MRKISIAIIFLDYPSVSYLQPLSQEKPEPITFIAQIDKIDIGKTAIGKDMKLPLADRFYFKSKTPCNRDTLSARPQSFGLTLKFEYFADGKIKEKSTYRQGKVVGEKIIYFPSGQVRLIAHKNDRGNDDGVSEEYSEEGKLLSTSTYKDGKQLAKKSWYENGQLKQEVLFDSEGRRDGVAKEWFANGQLNTLVSYKHDVKDGNAEEWRENGQPKSLYPYKDGKLDGESKYWDERGKLQFTTTYKADKKNGPDRRWSVNTGKIIEEVDYVDDIKNGMKKEFNDRTGKLLSAVPYVDGDMHGTEETYDQDGVSVIRCYRKNEQLAALYKPTEITNKANQGDAAAQYELGKYHLTCTDSATGMAWLEKSAKQGNSAAQLLLTKS